MKPSENTKNGLISKMEQQQQERKRPRKTMYIAASLVIAAGIGIAGPNIWQQINGPAAPAQVAQVDPGTGITIPKVELPDPNAQVQASMIPLVVYEGNVYTQTLTRMEAADLAALRGDKLGTTTGGIDEWTGKDGYTELSSNIGVADIYTVKGYGSGFLIMSYMEIDGQVFADLYEHTNGITVNSGADLLGELNLEGRIASARWESFDSWNNGQQQYAPLAGGEALDGFLSALEAAKPLAAEPLIEQGIYESEDRKIVYLELEDKVQVQLVLFGQGLVRYGNAPVFFELESGAFQALWDSMTP
ncbi:hypothetical protein [Paenibacillus sp. FSL R7-0331]|uniref:hypothetical protein n=1 Tax=Paenibacillus sp. FSL R7-0331 TaxID=1536773 RepID=UPI000A72E40B|nr:hypothetical protein [Paenibacillus sp. FSL R7-0331]